MRKRWIAFCILVARWIIGSAMAIWWAGNKDDEHRGQFFGSIGYDIAAMLFLFVGFLQLIQMAIL